MSWVSLRFARSSRSSDNVFHLSISKVVVVALAAACLGNVSRYMCRSRTHREICYHASLVLWGPLGPMSHRPITENSVPRTSLVTVEARSAFRRLLSRYLIFLNAIAATLRRIQLRSGWSVCAIRIAFTLHSLAVIHCPTRGRPQPAVFRCLVIGWIAALLYCASCGG